MKIALGADHGGYELKEEIKKHLEGRGIPFVDFGTDSTASIDYPDMAVPPCKAVQSGECDFALLFCGTGVGISMAANRMKGIRCVNASEEYTVKLSRHHNNSNMISIGARVVGTEKAISLMDTFLTEEFDGDRHQRRIDLVDTL